AERATQEVIGSELIGLSRLISILLAFVGLGLVYFVVPNRTVALRDAAIGAAAAAVALEGLKALFGLYISSFSSYALVYGALAAIPIFLLWMYAFWVVVLGGAEITAALPEWRVTSRRDRGGERIGARLALALSVLCRLREAQVEGTAISRSSLLGSLPVTPAEFDECLSLLGRARLVQRSDGGRLLLGRDLAQVDLD